MKQQLVAILLYATTIYGQTSDHIIGSWTSDASRSINSDPRIAESGSPQREAWSNLLSDMTIQFTASQAIARVHGRLSTNTYRVIAGGPDFVTIRLTDAPENLRDDLTYKYRQSQSNLMWILIGNLTNYYRRVDPLSEDRRVERDGQRILK